MIYTVEFLQALAMHGLDIPQHLQQAHENALEDNPESAKPFRKSQYSAFPLSSFFFYFWGHSEPVISLFNLKGVGPSVAITRAGKGESAQVKKMINSKGQVYALKIVDIEADNQRFADFMAECDALRQLGRLKGWALINDKGYIAMDYYDGVDLDKLTGYNDIDSDKSISYVSIARTLQIFAFMAAELSLLHSLGLLHNDVKPNNFRLVGWDTPHWNVKIIDFGFTRRKNIPFSGGSNIAAPECFTSSKRTVQTDIYTLGMSFLWMMQWPSSLHGCLELGRLIEIMTNKNPVLRPSPSGVIKALLFIQSKYGDEKHNPLGDLIDSKEWSLAAFLISEGASLKVYDEWHTLLENEGLGILHTLSGTDENDQEIFLNFCAIAVLQKIQAIAPRLKSIVSLFENVIDRPIRDTHQCACMIIAAIEMCILNRIASESPFPSPVWGQMIAKLRAEHTSSSALFLLNYSSTPTVRINPSIGTNDATPICHRGGACWNHWP